jgi:voltage-gated potassium channel Kch
LALSVLFHVVSQKTVTRDTVMGAICSYLLIGVAFGLCFAMIEFEHPGSIVDRGHAVAAIGPELEHRMGRMFYLSFITLTTVGYGDVSPIGPAARMLAVFEALLGQLFLAVFIARLVGAMGRESGSGD